MHNSMLVNIIDMGCLNMIVKTGNAIPLTTDAMETILKIMNVASQVKTTRPNTGLSAAILIANPSKTPKVVATPLPPLNLKNIVQICPQIELIPNKMRKVSAEIPLTFNKKISARKITGRSPLSISISKTVKPNGFPNTRNALVAPTFPEPNLRMSMPFTTLPKI